MQITNRFFCEKKGTKTWATFFFIVSVFIYIISKSLFEKKDAEIIWH